MVSSKEKKCVKVFKNINIDVFFLYLVNKKTIIKMLEFKEIR